MRRSSRRGDADYFISMRGRLRGGDGFLAAEKNGPREREGERRKHECGGSGFGHHGRCHAANTDREAVPVPRRQAVPRDGGERP